MFRIANVCKLFVTTKEMTNKTLFCGIFIDEWIWAISKNK